MKTSSFLWRGLLLVVLTLLPAAVAGKTLAREAAIVISAPLPVDATVAVRDGTLNPGTMTTQVSGTPGSEMHMNHAASAYGAGPAGRMPPEGHSAAAATGLSLSAPEQMTVGKPVSVTATLRDSSGQPVSKAVILFSRTSPFMTGSRDPGLLLEIGRPKTDSQGMAAIGFTPTEDGQQDFVAAFEKQQARAPVLVRPGSARRYTPEAGIRLPLSASWVLTLLVLGIWGTYLRVMRQVWRIGGASPQRDPVTRRFVPIVGSLVVVTLASTLIWIVQTSPYTHRLLGPPLAPWLETQDVHPSSPADLAGVAAAGAENISSLLLASPLLTVVVLAVWFGLLMIVSRMLRTHPTRPEETSPRWRFVPVAGLAAVIAVASTLVWFSQSDPGAYRRLGLPPLPGIPALEVRATLVDSDGRQTRAPAEDTGSRLGASASARLGQLPLPEPGAKRGESVFRTYCAGCHGSTADGAVGPTLKKEPVDSHNAAEMVRGGSLKKMPAFTQMQMADIDLESVVAYLVSIGAAKPEDARGPAPTSAGSSPAVVEAAPTATGPTPTPTTAAAPPAATPTQPAVAATQPAAAATQPPPAATQPPAPAQPTATTAAPPPPAAGAAFTVNVSRDGFNGQGGAQNLSVRQGQSVQITFVYADEGLGPDNEHVISIDAYNQTVKLTEASPRAVMTISATQPGAFNIMCTNDECQGHKKLQQLFLQVQ